LMFPDRPRAGGSHGTLPPVQCLAWLAMRALLQRVADHTAMLKSWV
jgi:hypothetical protein